MKKHCFIVIMLLTIMSLTPAFSWAEESQTGNSGTEAYSGKLGESVYWDYDDGTLTISGEGKMSNKIAPEEQVSQSNADYTVKKDGETRAYYVRSPFRDISKKIKKVVIRKGVTTVADRLFVGLTNLQEVRMSDSVATIGKRAFQNCRSLRKVRFPKSCSMGAYAFSGCINLKGDLHLPDCGNISEAAFKDCTGIVNVFISPFTHSFDYKAFEGCSSMKTVQGAYNVTSIFNKAFFRCTSLKSISLGKISKIRKNAFSGCNSLKALYYTGTKQQFKKNKIYKGNKVVSRAQLYTNRIPKVAIKCAVSRDYNKILIEWENSCHTDGYQVYYATKKSGPYKRLSAKVIKRNYGKNSGIVHRKASFDKTYYYKVRAYKLINGRKSYGDFSDVVSAKSGLQKVKKIQAKAGKNSVTLMWDAVNGADGYIISYHVSGEEWTETDVSGKTNYVLKSLESGNCNYKITAYRLKKNKPVCGPESRIGGIRIDNE